MAEKLVSIVLPVYNRENTIKRAVDSVLNQTYSYLELIIVDDGSTDNTVNIIEAYKDDRIRLICQEHGGANKARNAGIVSTKGEYIAFQDSDDEWMPDKLDEQIKRMEEGGHLACYSAYNLYDNDFMYTIPPDFNDQNKYGIGLGEILAGYNVVGTPTLMIKRKVLTLLDNEYFDEDMPRMQDYEFVIRLFKACKLDYINRPLVNAFRTEESITANTHALYLSVGRIIQKHKDFLDVGRVMDNVIRAEVGIEQPCQLMEDLRKLQESAGLDEKECKGRMFMYMSKKLNIYNQLSYRLYQFAVDNLQDGRFSIYGAGTIGHEVYYNLKKKGLHPACFLVTKCVDEKFIDNVPVLSIDDYSNREDMVIISIAAEYQVELMDNLIARKYRQFCVYYRILV